MKLILTVLMGLFVVSASAQETNKKIEDQFKHKQVMLNECTREGLVTFPEFKASYDANYQNYKVDSATLPQLSKLMKDKKIKVVLGTWCGDSKFQVPHFLKITDALEIKEKNISYIAVDGAKKAENGLLDGLDIQRVPTFIITDKKGNEVGRIIERPKKSLELDLLELLSAKK
jgi:thiol-disulfide isomerase/thioredoxin